MEVLSPKERSFVRTSTFKKAFKQHKKRKTDAIKVYLKKGNLCMNDLSKPLERWQQRRGGDIYVKTVHGSYVCESDDGMARQKNAMSRKELVRYGYVKLTGKKK